MRPPQDDRGAKLVYNIHMRNAILISAGKSVSGISRLLNKGNGSTWPGHIALNVNKNFIKDILRKNPQLKIILIAGTNGKTTTAKLITSILENNGNRVFQNKAGANLLNGIASSLLLHSSILCAIPYDYAVFEVDENSLPLVLKELSPDYLILLNLFRDQLDRYGEVNTIADKWQKAIEQLSNKTIVILNADDPQIAFLGTNLSSRAHSINLVRGDLPEKKIAASLTAPRNDNTFYFGLDDKKLHQNVLQHAVDSTYCPNCKNKLTYKTVYFSHLGDWKCSKCGFARGPLDGKDSPYYPLPGVYNQYNTNAAVLFAKLSNISNETIKQSLKKFSPAFGRQEIIHVDGKKVQLFLSKNPTSFNQSLRTIKDLGATEILLVLNDHIPDGRDVSWIWDVDFENYLNNSSMTITISGDRCYDLGLRLRYTSTEADFRIEEDLKIAVIMALQGTYKTETLYILPTYSAMLEARKILTGKKIL